MGAGRRGHQIIAWHSAPLALRLVPSAFRLSPFAWHPSPLALSTALSARLASHRPVLTPGGAAAVAAARADPCRDRRDRGSGPGRCAAARGPDLSRCLGADEG